MTPLNAMKQALAAMEAWESGWIYVIPDIPFTYRKEIANLRTVIAELESAEPVAYAVINGDRVVQLSVTQDPFYPHSTPLFAYPAQSRDSIIEECAEVCDSLRQEWARLKVGAYDGRYDMMEEAATVCEDSIRALKWK